MLLFCSVITTSALASPGGREVVRWSLEVVATGPTASVSVIDSFEEWKKVFRSPNAVSRRRRQCNSSSSLFRFFGYLLFFFQNAGFYHGWRVSCTPIHFKHYSSRNASGTPLLFLVILILVSFMFHMPSVEKVRLPFLKFDCRVKLESASRAYSYQVFFALVPTL